MSPIIPNLLLVRCRTVARLAGTLVLAAAAAAAPLIDVSISPEGRVKASLVEPAPVLKKAGWTEYQIVIENTAGLTSPLAVECRQTMASDTDASRKRWLKLELVPAGPLTGAREETRTLRLWSRDAGRRAAIFNVNAGQGSQDLGFRSDVLVTFLVKAEG